MSISAGNFDLTHVLLCNGYRTELEPHSPLNDALASRRWDLLALLLDWGADPAGAEVWRILDTYERAVFERFWTAGVDLTADGAMAGALASSTSNRPLYGFAKNYRDRDPRVARALDVALGEAIRERNAKAISLCLWAGADSRHRVGAIEDDPQDDEDGMTAVERAVSADAPEYLKKLGFDPMKDDLQALFGIAWSLDVLRELVAIGPPADWASITERFIQRLAFSVRVGIDMTSSWELEEVFALGGRLGAMDRSLKRDLRYLLLTLDEYGAQRLFRILRDPKHMDPAAFLDLIAHKKLAALYTTWSWHKGVDRALRAELAEARGVPAPVRRMAKARVTPARRVVARTCLREAGVQRVLTREELYELVWSEPLLSLSKRFGLSDNGLRKRCMTMDVPTPPRGYWRRLASGRRIKRAPLPPLSETD